MKKNALLLALLVLGLSAQPAAATDAQELVTKNNCLMCHSLNGQGGKMAPPLEMIHTWSNAERVAQYIATPKQVNPKSIMPPYDKLPEADIQAMTHYIMGLGK